MNTSRHNILPMNAILQLLQLISGKNQETLKYFCHNHFYQQSSDDQIYNVSVKLYGTDYE